MTRRAVQWLAGVCVAIGLVAGASAQGTAKKDLVQRILAIQQSEIETVARGLIERPAAQMMQEAGLALQRQVAPDKREAMAKSIEAEVKKYVDESYPLVRERALRIAPTTIGAVLEEKMTEDELKQLLAWLESPVNKKYQTLGPDMRNGFVQKLLTDARPVVDPKLQALDGRIRQILGVPAAPAASAPPAGPARPAAPAARASGK
jgi:hypothetical protein